MRTNRFLLMLVPLLFAPSLAIAAVNCGSESAVLPLPVRTTPVPPLANGLAGRPAMTGMQHVLLAQSRDESLALDLVLLRLSLESCVKDEFADYKPRTQFDNTPWRYNMEKGKNFTAAEFDAWMKSRGVRVAKGKASEPAAAAATETIQAVSE